MNLKTLYKISYGLYIVSSIKDEKLNGQIANTVFQITSDPATLAISINKQNLTHEYISASKIFSVSILEQDTPLDFIGHFGFKSGRELNKFKDLKFSKGNSGLPIELEHTLGYMEAEVINSIDVETHTIFIGKIVSSEILKEAEPMTYAYYHLLKQGKVSKGSKADNNKPNTNLKAEKYFCKICGYVYDQEVGDASANVKPGTSFEDLPDNWKCPVCGVGKEKFRKVS